MGSGEEHSADQSNEHSDKPKAVLKKTRADESFFNFVTEVPMLLVPLGILGQLIVLSYFFLRYGDVPQKVGVYELNQIGVHIEWVNSPDGWYGLHTVIVWFLGFFGPIGILGVPNFIYVMTKDR